MAPAPMGFRGLICPVPQGAHHAPLPPFLAMCSAYTLAEQLRISSLLRRQGRAKRGAVSRPTRAPVSQLQPTTNTDTLSDTRSVCTRGGRGTSPGGYVLALATGTREWTIFPPQRMDVCLTLVDGEEVVDVREHRHG